MILDLDIARTRGRWQGRDNVDSFVAQVELSHGPQHLKNVMDTDIVRRFMVGRQMLDVGIGTGRVSLPLLDDNIALTGVDVSAAMIERCAADTRAPSVRLVHGELEQLPFAAETFDTVISVDTFTHFSNWKANLDELVRVTRDGGRTIVDLGSGDHVNAAAQQSRRSAWSTGANESSDGYAPTLHLTCAQLCAYAAERDLTLVALVPYGAVYGTIVPNFWLADSYCARSGGLDRLVSWMGTDPAVFDFARFIERRVVQGLPPSIGSRMFVVLERRRGAAGYVGPSFAAIADQDERGPDAWQTELTAHLGHEPNRAFIVALLLAARPAQLPASVRGQLPELVVHDLELAERAAHISSTCADAVAGWQAGDTELTFHGVDLTNVFARSIQRTLQHALESLP